jgi:nucleotide-binding universal stress UspA family protein
MDKIIVGVDGSEASLQALAWAADEAAVHGWGVRAMMAWGWVDQHRTLLGEAFDPGYSQDDAQSTLDGYIEAAVGPAAAGVVEGVVVAELPGRTLIDASRSAALLVVGARGLGGFRGLLLGSVSQRCLQQAHCPVAVLRPGDRPHQETHRVAVGVDDSPGAQAALQWALREAGARQSTLEVVHAWHPPLMGGYPITALSDPAVYEQAAGEELRAALAPVDLAALSHPLEQSVVQGSPAATLIDASQRADLVVVGAHGGGRLHGALLGAASNQVAAHAGSAVVVVRGDPDPT